MADFNHTVYLAIAFGDSRLYANASDLAEARAVLQSTGYIIHDVTTYDACKAVSLELMEKLQGGAVEAQGLMKVLGF